MQEKVILFFSPSSSQGTAVLWGALTICSLDEFWKMLHFHFPQSTTAAELHQSSSANQSTDSKALVLP